MDVTDQDVIDRLYAALNRGDADKALAMLDPAITWTEAESSRYFAGELRGRAAVARTVLTPIARDFDEFAVLPATYLAQGNQVAVFGEYIGMPRATDHVLKAAFVHLWTVHDGMPTRLQMYTDTLEWQRAFSTD